MLDQISQQTHRAVCALLEAANLREGDVLVVGCSTSEVTGRKIGTASSFEVAQAIFEPIRALLQPRGILLAVQCCEHLNRAVLVEEETARRRGLDIVNVVPQQHAGGAFAVTAYRAFSHPVAVEHIRAEAGMDIGDTLIGMQLREVAVPVRAGITEIGQAHLTLARTRPKYIGGPRAAYDESLM